MSLRRATGRGVMWSGTGYLAQYVVTFVFTIVTARLLDPEDFGLMGLASVVLAVGTLLADSGTQAALIHREHDVDRAVNTAMVSVPIAGLLAAFLGAVSAPFLAWFYDNDELTLITVILSGVLFLRSFGLVTDALLQRRLQFKHRRAVVDPLGAFMGGVTATVLALMGAGVWALVAQWYASTATLVIGSWILARYRPDLRQASIRTWRELARYGRHILGAHTVEMGSAYLDVMTVGKNLSTAAVGWYGAAGRLAIMPISGITHVAGAALFPAFSRMQNEPERLRDRFLEALRYISLVTIPVCVALAAVAQPFMVTLFGEPWKPAAPIIAILMLWAIPYSLLEVAMEAFKGIGRPAVVMQMATLNFVALAAYLAVVWALGAVSVESVAGGLGFAMIASIVAIVPMVRRHLNAPAAALWHTLAPSLVGGVVSAAIVVPVSWLWLGDLQGWRVVGGVNLGPLMPLVGMAGICAAAVGIFVLAAEVCDRNAVRFLIREGRSVLGGGSAETSE